MLHVLFNRADNFNELTIKTVNIYGQPLQNIVMVCRNQLKAKIIQTYTNLYKEQVFKFLRHRFKNRLHIHSKLWLTVNQNMFCL